MLLIIFINGCALINDADVAARMDLDGDGIARPEDCDDNDAAIGEYVWYADGDGDGYGGPSTVLACAAPDGFVANDADCNDADASVVGLTWYFDADADTFGDPATAVETCDGPNDYVLDGTDCDDTRADVYPGARDYCDDGADNDCDGTLDNLQWYVDADGDAFGSPDAAVTACDPPPGYVEYGTDCDDADPGVHPYGTEVCDTEGVDENCNGLVNDEDPGATGRPWWYQDLDRDTYGGGSPISACSQPADRIADGTDCDDGDPNINPAEAEIWYDGVDQDCDGNDADQDFDGYASDAHGGDDCDDTDWFVNAGVLEACGDGIDNDCDGVSAGECALSGDLTVDDAEAVLFGSIASGQAGSGVAGVGDLDGDGFADLVVGAPLAADSSGTVYLVHGPVGGEVDLEAEAERFVGCEADSWAGKNVTAGGDIDGDGAVDWVLGAPYFDSHAGSIYVLGGTGGRLCDAGSSVAGAASTYLGTSIAGAGDADGDGQVDVAAGDVGGAGGAGRVLLITGPIVGAQTVPVAASLTLESGAYGYRLGSASTAFGDLNGDGVDEIIASDPYESALYEHAGAVYLIDGTQVGTVIVDDADAIVRGGRAGERLQGGGVNAGDTDGDGLTDMMVPDHYHDDDYLGAVFLFTSRPVGALTVDDADAVITETREGMLGQYASSAGDVNGDGRGDLVAFSWEARDRMPGDLLFLGPFAGTYGLDDAQAGFVGSMFSNGGGATASVGDVSGDGFDDIVFGASTDSTYATNAGAAYLFLGGAE